KLRRLSVVSISRISFAVITERWLSFAVIPVPRMDSVITKRRICLTVIAIGRFSFAVIANVLSCGRVRAFGDVPISLRLAVVAVRLRLGVVTVGLWFRVASHLGRENIVK